MITPHRKGKSPSLAQACAGAFLVLLLGGLQGCSSSNSSNPVVPAGSLAGVWMASDPEGAGTDHLLILPDGSFRILADGNFTMGSGMGTVSGQALGSTGFLIFPNAEQVKNHAATPQAGSFSGTAVAGASITGTVTVGSDSYTGTFTPDPSASGTVTLASLAGNYQAQPGATSMGLLTGLQILYTPNAAQATFTGSNANGAITSGTITQPQAGLDGFIVNYTVTPQGGQAQPFSGSAYLVPNTPNSTLYFMTDNGGGLTGTQASAIFTMANPPDGTDSAASAAGFYTGENAQTGEWVHIAVGADGKYLGFGETSGNVETGQLGATVVNGTPALWSTGNKYMDAAAFFGGTGFPLTGLGIKQADGGVGIVTWLDLGSTEATINPVEVSTVYPDVFGNAAYNPLNGDPGILNGTYEGISPSLGTTGNPDDVELLFHYAAGTATLTMTDSLGNSMVATMTLTSTDNLEFEGTLTLTPAGEGATVQNYQVWGWVGTNGAGTQSLFIAGEDPTVTGEGIVFEFPLTPNQDTTL